MQADVLILGSRAEILCQSGLRLSHDVTVQGLQSRDDPVAPKSKLGVIGSRRVGVHEEQRI